MQLGNKLFVGIKLYSSYNFYLHYKSSFHIYSRFREKEPSTAITNVTYTKSESEKNRVTLPDLLKQNLDDHIVSTPIHEIQFTSKLGESVSCGCLFSLCKWQGSPFVPVAKKNKRKLLYFKFT